MLKTTSDVTRSAEAVAAIEAAGRRTIVLTGFETDTCVAQSAIGLHEAGYRVVVPEDATYSTRDVEHRQGIARIRRWWRDPPVQRHHVRVA